jgi:hypothetical protein
MGTKVVLRDVQIAFPEVFTAKEFKGTLSYSCKFLLEKGSKNEQNIDAAIQAEASAKWGARAVQKLKQFSGIPTQDCLIDGDTRDTNGYAGHTVLTAKRSEKAGRPVVVNRNKAPLMPADGKIYSGAVCNGTVEIWMQDDDNAGKRCTLINLQFVRDGEAFGGAAPATDDGLDDLGFEEDLEDDDLA